MPRINRAHIAGIRGAGRLVADASTGVVGVVERMHRTIQRRPNVVGQAITEPTTGITGIVYGSIRGGMNLVAWAVDASLESLERVVPVPQAQGGGEVVNSILNGLYGDHLVRTGNPLAIDMGLSYRGQPLDVDNPATVFRENGFVPSHRVMILLHGLCMSTKQWTREGANPSAILADSLGCTPLYLRYNSGLPIADNGRQLAECLERLIDHWPVPIRELTLVGHSMGGLVARAACHRADNEGHRWPGVLRRLVFLGTPHHGAPLERGGHGLDYLLDISPYSAPLTKLGRTRSAGIQDLRHGTITPGEHRHIELPSNVEAYAIAATLGEDGGALVDHLIGDGLVPVASALGRHSDPDRSLQFRDENTWIATGLGHLGLLHHPKVYRQLGRWLGGRATR